MRRTLDYARQDSLAAFPKSDKTTPPLILGWLAGWSMAAAGNRLSYLANIGRGRSGGGIKRRRRTKKECDTLFIRVRDRINFRSERGVTNDSKERTKTDEEEEGSGRSIEVSCCWSSLLVVLDDAGGGGSKVPDVSLDRMGHAKPPFAPPCSLSVLFRSRCSPTSSRSRNETTASGNKTPGRARYVCVRGTRRFA